MSPKLRKSLFAAWFLLAFLAGLLPDPYPSFIFFFEVTLAVVLFLILVA